MKRKISELERQIIEGVALKLPSNESSKLLKDLNEATAEDLPAGDGCVRFFFEDQETRPYDGQHQYPVEIRMLDKDQNELTALLYADGSNRLFELEFIKWGSDSDSPPDPSTIVFY